MLRLLALFIVSLSRASAQTVSVLAGGGAPGFADGAASRWSCPTGVAAGANVLLVTDGANGVVRAVTPAGFVSTLAGAPGASALVDGVGPAARFAGPLDLGIEPSGAAVVIADGNNHAIRRLAIVRCRCCLPRSARVLLIWHVSDPCRVASQTRRPDKTHQAPPATHAFISAAPPSSLCRPRAR